MTEPTTQLESPTSTEPETPAASKASKSLFSLGLDDLDAELHELDPIHPDTFEDEPSGPDIDAQRLPAFLSYLKTRPELSDKQSLNAILQLRQFEVQGPELCFVLANDFEWRFVEAERQWLTDLARQQLAHPTLKLTYRVDPDLEAAEAERLRQQSPDYRIARMIARNPHLQTLIERFGLQPE